ncbi:hypothetical protein scyTo_0011965 [Scyliorhinus torazame]|uniref:Uncharacterized protein n=3 Tax=Scyliorhinus torazame TaxID=75743 RepID=A0A401NZ38_SCYTO|nr:hypothetical protein [Scyliorhinus torazame]
MKLNYAFLASDTASSTYFVTEAVASSGQNPNVIENERGTSTTVNMEAIYNFKPKLKVAMLIITLSLILGFSTLAICVIVLCKCGFFQRKIILKGNDNDETEKCNRRGGWKSINQEETD